MTVQEILDLRPIARLPHAPASFLGLTDVRGHSVPVVDLRRLLGLPLKLVAKGKVAHEETTGSKVWTDRITPVGGAGTHLSALRTAVEHHQVVG